MSAKARGDGEVYADRRSAEIALEMAAGGAFAIVEGIAKDYRVVEVEDGWSVLDIGYGTDEPRWLIEDLPGWIWGDRPVFAEDQEDLGVWYVRLRGGGFAAEEVTR